MADVEMAPPPGIAGQAPSATLPLDLPASLPLDALLAAIPPSDSVGEITLQRLAAPDAHLVIHVYQALLALPQLRQAVEALEKERSERQKRDVDAEADLHQAESLRAQAEERADADRAAKEQALKEKAELSSQLAAASASLAALQSTAESGQSQSADVKGRLEAVEQEKRDLLAVLDREKQESARRADEIDALSKRNRESRQEVSRLSTELQEARAAEATIKFKLQSVEQELTLARNDAEWANKELTRANETASAFRTSKHAELVRLQTELETVTQSSQAANAKVSTLQSAYDGVSKRLDEASRKTAELTARIAEQEDGFQSEMQMQQRLVTLLERRAEDAQRRTEELEGHWEKVLGQCREREEAALGEAEAEREARTRLEREKEDLEHALDRLAQGVGIDTGDVEDDAPSAAGSRASTPRRATLAHSLNVGLGASTMSPTAALASRLQKSGKSFTQVYADYARTQEELRRSETENKRLGGILQQVMNELDERAPAMKAQREEVERLSIDLEEMSASLARACEERDAAERQAREQRLIAEETSREHSLLSQQLADAGRQVRALVRELLLRDDPAAAARLEDDGTPLPDASAGAPAPSNTQAVITAQLVTFRDLTELVAQNGRLLRVTRELGAKMEAEEANYRARLEQGESEAVDEARAIISKLTDEVKLERSRVESIRRERDMFRSMCAGGGAAGRLSASVTNGGGSGDNNAASVAIANQYAQLQAQFETFRTETANDTERLKEDAHAARSEASKSAVAAAREKATRETVEERYRTLQQTFELQRSELNELNKRTQALQENVARRDIAAHSTEEQLLEARSNLERLRNEASNLRAEKELHKGTTERLLEDNRSLVAEKASLSELLRNVQSMQNELEKSEADAKRRLETTVERLEEQLKEAKESVARAEENAKQASAKREVETHDLQARLEKANEELASAREQLAVARTSVTHLTSRSEDLAKQLEAKEEKLAVYERRTGSGATAGATAGATSTLTREQQLEVELADLRGELRSAQIEVEQAKAHAEQFKEIAQAHEEALGELQGTYDLYKTQTDASLAAKETEIKSLRERQAAIIEELTAAQTEASSAQTELSSERNKFAKEKKDLQDAIAAMHTADDEERASQEDVRADVKRQAELALEAHNKYEQELVAHAEDVKTLTAVKQELERVRAEVLEAIKARETAEANLTSSTSSWEAQKELIQQEKVELEKNAKELQSQNKILHGHLEALSAQAAQIQQAATAGGSATGGGSATAATGGAEGELHEVIKFLRREKEIADLQVELREQECARLRVSAERAQRSLDEVKAQLAEERQRQTGTTSSARQHEELLEKINQLSILRESNQTLRDEAERAVRKAAQLETALNAKAAELEPIKEECRLVKVELEATQGQLKVVQEDNKRWQGRAQDILSKNNRIDPEDVKRLEERASAAEKALEEARQQAQQEHEALQKQVDEQTKAVEAAKTETANSRTQFDRLRQQSIERIKTLNQKIQEAAVEAESLKTEKASLQQQLQEAQNASEAAPAPATTVAMPEADQQALVELRLSHEKLEEQVNLLQSQLAEKEQELQLARQQLSAAQSATAAVTGKGGEGGASAEAVQQAIEEAKKAWLEEKTQLETAKQTAERREQQHLTKAKEFLANFRKASAERDELQSARDGLEAKLKEQWAADHAQEIEAAVQARISSGASATDDAADALKKRVADLEEQLRAVESASSQAQAAGEGNADIEALKVAHAAELQDLRAKLSQQFDQRQRQAVEIAVKKAQAAGAGAGAGAAASPEEIEEAVQQRLAALETERGEAQQAAIAAAIEAKEKELAAAKEEYGKQRYEAGKEEATLRNKLMLKQKDTKIDKLTAEIATLKGEPVPAKPAAAAAPAAPGTAAPAHPAAAAPAAAGAAPPSTVARGGAPTRGAPAGRGRGGAAGVALPARPAAATGEGAAAGGTPATRGGVAVRGAGAGRGGRGGAVGRGGGVAGAAAAAAAAANANANVGKRKLDATGSQSGASPAGTPTGPGGDSPAAKKARQAGGPARGGAAGRGGRGGGNAGAGGA